MIEINAAGVDGYVARSGGRRLCGLLPGMSSVRLSERVCWWSWWLSLAKDVDLIARDKFYCVRVKSFEG